MIRLIANNKVRPACTNVLVVINEGNENLIDEDIKDFIDKFSVDNSVNIYQTEKFIYRPKYQLSFQNLSQAYNNLDKEIKFLIVDDKIPVYILEQTYRHLKRIGLSESILKTPISGTNACYFYLK